MFWNTYNNIQYFQYFFRIKLDGKIFDTVENKNPQVFQNVKVLACSQESTECHYGYPPAGAIISSLVYQGKFSIGILYIIQIIQLIQYNISFNYNNYKCQPYVHNIHLGTIFHSVSGCEGPLLHSTQHV